jgi:hypothetical protein
MGGRGWWGEDATRGARRLETRWVYVGTGRSTWVHSQPAHRGQAGWSWSSSSSRPRPRAAKTKTARAGRLLGTICLIGRLAGGDQHLGQARAPMRQGAGIPAANHGCQTSPDIPQTVTRLSRIRKGLNPPATTLLTSASARRGEAMQHLVGALLSPLKSAAAQR